MASLTIGDFKFGLASFHMNEYSIEPEMDPSGVDILCSKVTLDIVGVVNRVAIATNKIEPGIPGSSGDTLPDTLIGIRDYLMRPRNKVIFEVGGTEVLRSPAVDPDNNAIELTCDIMGGPFPQRASLTNAVGDKSAILQYRVTTYVSYCEKYLLSNRWTSHESVGHDAFTTRTIHGKAIFRKDYLDFDELEPDDFRKWLIIPKDAHLRRLDLSVTQNAEGTELDYSFTDREVRYGVGNNDGVLEITGTVTGGCDSEIKNATQFAGAAGELAWKTLKGVFGNVASIFEISGTISKFIPHSKFAAVARVTGMNGTSQQTLALIAIQVCIDRLVNVYKPSGGLGFISSLFITCNLSSDEAPYAQCSMECYGMSMKILKDTFKFDPQNQINVSKTFPANGPLKFMGPSAPAPGLPASGGTRGTTLVRMVTQALLAPEDSCSVPAAPPASDLTYDTGGLY